MAEPIKEQNKDFNDKLASFVAPTHSENSEQNNTTETQVPENPVAPENKTEIFQENPVEQEGLPTEATVTEEVSVENTQKNSAETIETEKTTQSVAPQAEKKIESQTTLNKERQDALTEQLKAVREAEIAAKEDEAKALENLEGIY